MSYLPSVLSRDSSQMILRGTVVTMNSALDVLVQGRVCIEKDLIVAVLKDGEPLPAGFETAPLIETNATIYPGLVELHTHLAYNMLPLWPVPTRYSNREQWLHDTDTYPRLVSRPAQILGHNPDPDYPRAIARYVECRSMLGGVTTTEGLSTSSGSAGYGLFSGLVRNVEVPMDPTWPAAEGQVLSYADKQDVAAKLVPALQKNRPFFYHLSEGTDVATRQTFLDLDQGATGWAINKHLIGIHCAALQASDFAIFSAAAGMVWSPMSNYLLYGATANVRAAKAAHVPIALGSDWAPSGTKNLLGELKVARLASDNAGGLFSNAELARMVTITPAQMLGWDQFIGSIERGKKADLIAIAGTGRDAFAHLIEAPEDSFVLIMIGGRPRLSLTSLFAPSSGPEQLRVGTTTYLLDLTEASPDPLACMSLRTAIAKLSYGLEHLPELAKDFPRQLEYALRADEDRTLMIELDFQEPVRSTRDLLERAMAIDPGSVERMNLDPITQIDDLTFKQRIKANINIPDFIRIGF